MRLSFPRIVDGVDAGARRSSDYITASMTPLTGSIFLLTPRQFAVTDDREIKICHPRKTPAQSGQNVMPDDHVELSSQRNRLRDALKVDDSSVSDSRVSTRRCRSA